MLRTRLQVVQFTDSKYHTSEQSSTFHIDAILVIKGRGLFFFLNLISMRRRDLYKDKRKWKKNEKNRIKFYS